MPSAGEYAAGVMRHLVDHASHGYTQGNRWGNGQIETVKVYDREFKVAKGDRDCSSACVSAWQAVGVDCGGASYTGNMRSCMVGTGNFEWKPMSFIASPGDMYLKEGHHVAMCLTQTPDTLMEFSISETGGIYGQEGDQTGRESHVRAYYDYPWDGILHYTGGASQGGTAAPKPTPKPAQSGIPALTYRASTDPSGRLWLPAMRDHTDTGGSSDDFAGERGKPIRWLAIQMPGWYQVKGAHGWLPAVRGYDVSDLDAGCAGDGSPITAIRCMYETQAPDQTGWLAIEYQAGDDSRWLPAMRDLKDTGGSSDDFAGAGFAITRFRARLVKA